MAVSFSVLRAGRPLSPGRSLVLISVRGSVDPRAIVRLEGLSQLKKSLDLIKNRTRHLLACNLVRQPNTLPRAPNWATHEYDVYRDRTNRGKTLPFLDTKIFLELNKLPPDTLRWFWGSHGVDYVFWDITPCSPVIVSDVSEEHIPSISKSKREPSSAVCLLHIRFFLSLLLDPEDGGDVSPKRRMTFTGLHGVIPPT
jgi:hypothetical protein